MSSFEFKKGYHREKQDAFIVGTLNTPEVLKYDSPFSSFHMSVMEWEDNTADSVAYNLIQEDGVHLKVLITINKEY